jgi:hypothetical protein
MRPSQTSMPSGLGRLMLSFPVYISSGQSAGAPRRREETPRTNRPRAKSRPMRRVLIDQGHDGRGYGGKIPDGTALY